MLQFDLSGEWKLYAVDPEKMEITQPSQLKGLKPITGSVPGNLELDLVRAGITKDPFIGENKNIYIISGKNLGMMMAMVTQDLNEDTENKIKQIIEECKQTIIYVNDFMK